MKSNKSMFLGGFIAMSVASVLVLSLILSLSVSLAQDNNDESFIETEKQRGFPVRGTSASNVLSKYGEPDSRSGPVGNPPISTWHYADLKVYFEHKMVITTVSNNDFLPTKLSDIQ